MKMKFLIAALVLCSAAPAALAIAVAKDVVTIGTGTKIGVLTYDIPIYIRDVSGTPLGIDQPFGSRIQSYSVRVSFPAGAPVQSMTISRAGITQSLTPTFESKPATSTSVSLIDTFQESTNLIPFVSNAAAPGNQVAHLIVTFTNNATEGTVVPLTLDATLTQLSNEGGTITETVALGTLDLVNGSVTVPAVVPALDVRMLALLAAALIGVALFVRKL